MSKIIASFYTEVIDTLRTQPTISLDNFLEGFKELNKGFEDEYGYSFQEFGKVMTAIAHYPVQENKNAPVTYLREIDLVKYIVDIAKVEKSKITSILENMSLDHSLLVNENIEPWKFRSRPHRLIIRPLIKINHIPEKYYLFGNWETDASTTIWISLVSQGRFPIHTQMLQSQKLKDAIQTRRQHVSTQFQRDVLKTVKKICTHAERVKKYGQFFESKKQIRGPGEIDVLAIHEPKKNSVCLRGEGCCCRVNSSNYKK
ncbi:MAG: hypothetical protein ACTSYO_07945 [Candidatus Ranarchaeia archaeon]